MLLSLWILRSSARSFCHNWSFRRIYRKIDCAYADRKSLVLVLVLAGWLICRVGRVGVNDGVSLAIWGGLDILGGF